MTTIKEDISTGIIIDTSRDERISHYAKKLITNYYLNEGETIQEGFARASFAWSGGDNALAQRVYDAVSKGWFMFASPVFSNAPVCVDKDNFGFAKETGLPISCFLMHVSDTVESLVNSTSEFRWLSVKGGGVGINFSEVRSDSDKSPGTIPFICTYNTDVDAYMQGSCYVPETEILTSKGWKRFDELEGNEIVAQVNSNNKTTFVRPTEFVKEYHTGKIINFTSKNKTFASVTPNHSMVVERKRNGQWTGKLEKLRADSVSFLSEMRMHVSTKVENVFATKLTPHEKFLVALQASGEFDKNIEGDHFCSISVKGKEKIKELENILIACGYDYNVQREENGLTLFSVIIPKNHVITKTFEDWIDITKVNSSWAKDFIKEISKWYTVRVLINKGVNYITTDKKCADIVNFVSVIAGYGSNVSIRKAKEHGNLYTVSISFNKNLIKNARITETEYSGYVYCCLVPEGKIIVRNGGQPIICGNTRRGSVAIYKDVSHPNIIEFLNLRVATGDESRKCHSVGFHNAVNIPNDFMEAVISNKDWNLVDPATKEVKEVVSARDLWDRIMEVRYRTGEPYLHFIDTANKFLPLVQKEMGLRINNSNLCLEGSTLITIKVNGDVEEEIRMDEFNEKFTTGHYTNVMVKSYDIENDTVVWEKITASGQTGITNELYEIESDDGKHIIRCTANHKIYTKNRGYVEAQYLQEDDDIVFDS